MDREKVIKGLHDARRYLEDKEWSDRGASPHIDAINDALDLLKEQEAVEPICQILFDVPYYFCGSCKTMLNMYATKAKYCSQCKRKVKWE